MAKNKSANEQMEELFQETEEIRASYKKALEQAEQEVVTLTREITEGDSHLHELYKSYVLNLVSLEAYQSEKKMLDDKKVTLHIAMKKVGDIEELMKEELYKVYWKSKDIQKDFNKERNALLVTKVQELKDKKKEYLKAIHEASKPMLTVDYHEVWISKLEVELGKKDYSYATNVQPSNFNSAIVTEADIAKVYTRKNIM